MSNQRTIKTILSLKTGEIIEVTDLFENQYLREAEIFQLRTQIEKDLQNDDIEFVCIFCKQAVAIRGRLSRSGTKHFYFTHPYKSDDCAIKTQSYLSQEQIRCIKYNGEKESILHDALKRLVGHYLSLDPEVNSVKIDKVYKDKAVSNKWRKPDVLANHKLFGKLAFELQLSTTFLSVIVARTLFYQKRGVYLIWIFPHFSLIDNLQKFTQKDVFYNNNSNVYVFDKVAIDKSKELGRLILTCYYKEFYWGDETILSGWNQKLIELNCLTFIDENKEVYYYNSEKTKKQIEIKAERLKMERQKKEREEMLNGAIDKITNILKDYYSKDWLVYEQECYLKELVSLPELNKPLNNLLKYNGQNVEVITRLFFERKKPNYLKFLCNVDSIQIDTSLIYRSGRTVFQEIIAIRDSFQFNQYLSYLFRKGYQLADCDLIDLKNIFERNRFNNSDIGREQIERWAMVKLYLQLQDRNAAFTLLSMQKILLAIMSVKHKMIIGFRYANFKQLTHYVLDNHKEYSITFLNALRSYRYYGRLLAEDKTDKLKARFNYLLRCPAVSGADEHLIFQLFPEMPYRNIDHGG